MKATKSYQDELIKSLKDPREAVEYINAALEESDSPEVFLLALRNVAEAYGITKLSRKTHLNRENLYRILSEKGNPEFNSLHSLLNGLGLRLHVELKEKIAD
ncbi:MAG: addiction module antidote protein [bacterium]